MTPGITSAVADEATEQPDDALIQQVLAGNTAVFELLMRRYNERVYRAALSILRDEAEAEDVMQQAYVNAYAHLRQFDGRASFATWLTRIAVNEAISRARRPARSSSSAAVASGIAASGSPIPTPSNSTTSWASSRYCSRR